MSTDTMDRNEQQDMDMGGSKPVEQHKWLQNLVGDWNVSSEMTMPDGQTMTSTGTETVRDLNGLWAYAEGQGSMPNGGSMEYFTGLGWDLTFNEYRGFWFASVSSHLWKYTGELSEDGKKMTLNCEGPNMMGEGTANYRDVIELIDGNTRTLTSYGQDDKGEWHQFMKATLTRK